MGKKVIRLDEAAIRRIIGECIKEAVEEDRYDYLDSGIHDYQGTGSKESKERVEKIRDKRKNLGYNGGFSPIYKTPGNNFSTRDDASSDLARKKFGGPNAKNKIESFEALVKPLTDKMNAFNRKNQSNAFAAFCELYCDMYRAYRKWSEKYRGTDFNGEE